MSPVVALDLGTRRIGVATSGPAGLAFPRPMIERTGDGRDHAAIAELVGELCATTLVIGLPIGLDGREGAAAQGARAEAAELAALLPDIVIELFDERLTTVTAGRALREAGKRAASHRSSVDSAAATVILEAWLAAHG